jgi:hypothetical protein
MLGSGLSPLICFRTTSYFWSILSTSVSPWHWMVLSDGVFLLPSPFYLEGIEKPKPVLSPPLSSGSPLLLPTSRQDCSPTLLTINTRSVLIFWLVLLCWRLILRMKNWVNSTLLSYVSTTDAWFVSGLTKPLLFPWAPSHHRPPMPSVKWADTVADVRNPLALISSFFVILLWQVSIGVEKWGEIGLLPVCVCHTVMVAA